MSRMNKRNRQVFFYALYAGTVVDRDERGYQIGTHAEYHSPVAAYGNVSAARGEAVARQFGDDVQYDKVIVLGDRETPIDEYTVLWIDRIPELDSQGALKVNADGAIVTPWDYIVRRVGRGVPNFGSVSIAVSKVSVS